MGVGGGGGAGANLGIGRLLVGHWGQKTFSKLLGSLPGPYSPTPLLLRLCYMYIYALNQS